MNNKPQYGIISSSLFKNNLKSAKIKGYDLSLLDNVVTALAAGLPLADKYKDRSLAGGCRECHITPDWILVYEISDNELILYLTKTGTQERTTTYFD